MRDAQDADVLTGSWPAAASRSLRISIPVAIAVVIADQLTKWWALGALEAGSCAQEGACIDLFGSLRFHLVYNTGAAFTRGSGYGPLLGVVAFFMAGVLLYLSARRTDRLGVVLYGLVAGGAIGNLLDRIFRADDGFLSGAVIDFIDLQWWPVFNVADSAIVVGVLAIIAVSLKENPSEEPAEGEAEPETAASTAEPETAASTAEPEKLSPDPPG